MNNIIIIISSIFITIGFSFSAIGVLGLYRFKDVYQNLLYLKCDIVNNKMISSSFLDDWLIDPEMRTYDKLDFLPMQETPVDIYNTFSGYEATKKNNLKRY